MSKAARTPGHPRAGFAAIAVSSQRNHSTCLQPVLTFLLVRHVADPVANAEPIEAMAENGVSVQIDLIATVGDKEPVVALGDKARDSPSRGFLMCLYVGPHHANIVLQPPPDSVEGVVDRDREILMRLMLWRFARHDDFASGHC